MPVDPGSIVNPGNVGVARLLCCGGGEFGLAECNVPLCFVVKQMWSGVLKEEVTNPASPFFGYTQAQADEQADYLDGVPLSAMPFPTRDPDPFNPGELSHPLFTVRRVRQGGGGIYTFTEDHNRAAQDEQLVGLDRHCVSANHERGSEALGVYAIKSKLLLWHNTKHYVTFRTTFIADNGEQTHDPPNENGAPREYLECSEFSNRRGDPHHMGDGLLCQVDYRPFTGGGGKTVRRVLFDEPGGDVPLLSDDYVFTCGPLDNDPP